MKRKVSEGLPFMRGFFEGGQGQGSGKGGRGSDGERVPPAQQPYPWEKGRENTQESERKQEKEYAKEVAADSAQQR
jgi:hypothetical protein